MNRAVFLTLPIAVVLAMLLAACAHSDADADANADAAALAAVLAPASAAASAAGAASDGLDDDRAFNQWASAEHRRIDASRAAANARYHEEARLCWQRIAVNACLSKAHDRRRAILDELRHDELTLNANQRERRTAARLNEIAHKQSDTDDADANAESQSNRPDAPAVPASGTP